MSQQSFKCSVQILELFLKTKQALHYQFLYQAWSGWCLHLNEISKSIFNLKYRYECKQEDSILDIYQKEHVIYECLPILFIQMEWRNKTMESINWTAVTKNFRCTSHLERFPSIYLLIFVSVILYYIIYYNPVFWYYFGSNYKTKVAVNLFNSFTSITTYCCVFESHQGHWILSCEEDIRLVPEIML